MSSKITAYKIHSAGVVLRGLNRLEGADKNDLAQLLFDISAQVAEREQSPAVDHSAMVAKLCKLSKQMNTSMHKVVAAYGVALDAILSADPTIANIGAPMSEHETSPAPTDSTLQDVADRLYHWHSDPSPVTIIDREIMGHLAAIVDAHIAGESP